ncbi:MAG: phosphohistidine phosphatase [Leucobacter sp.]|jgi:phosphohistidine phosphatase|nr:phosphohistidine phosphatase [Leucobacter sp.]
MLTLVLVRHAKSDWTEPALADHDRPLNARGRRDAPAKARKFAELNTSGSILPIERIISSTATRARTTAAEFATALALADEHQFSLDHELYLASAEELSAAAAHSRVSAVLLVAHDPGITELASRLSAGEIDRMPTCAVAMFNFHADDWQEVNWSRADTWNRL